MSADRPVVLIRACGNFTDPKYDPTYGHCGHAPKCTNTGVMDDRDPLGCCNCGTRVQEVAADLLAAARASVSHCLSDCTNESYCVRCEPLISAISKAEGRVPMSSTAATVVTLARVLRRADASIALLDSRLDDPDLSILVRSLRGDIADALKLAERKQS